MTEREVGDEVRDVGDWWLDHVEPEVSLCKALGFSSGWGEKSMEGYEQEWHGLTYALDDHSHIHAECEKMNEWNQSMN